MAIGQKILGFLSGGFAEKGLGLIDKVVKDKDLAENLKAEFRTLVATQDHEYRTLLLEVDQDFEREQTKRIQAEQASNDTYTKRTRPMIARRSFYFGSLYILAHVVTDAIPTVAAVLLDPYILALMYSPALAYAGVRSIDKWKNGQ